MHIAARQWPDNICGGQITYRPASVYEGFALADAEHGIPTFGAVKATGTTIFNYPGQTEDIAKQLCHRWNVHGDLLAALKECALEIAQTRNRKLTAGEQSALDAARAAIAKATAA